MSVMGRASKVAESPSVTQRGGLSSSPSCQKRKEVRQKRGDRIQGCFRKTVVVENGALHGHLGWASLRPISKRCVIYEPP
jgi:hypothetical protein